MTKSTVLAIHSLLITLIWLISLLYMGCRQALQAFCRPTKKARLQPLQRRTTAAPCASPMRRQSTRKRICWICSRTPALEAPSGPPLWAALEGFSPSSRCVSPFPDLQQHYRLLGSSNKRFCDGLAVQEEVIALNILVSSPSILP